MEPSSSSTHNRNRKHKQRRKLAKQWKQFEPRSWADLPSDLMLIILMKLGHVVILKPAQLVCTWWRKICKDPVLWITIDMYVCVGSSILLCNTRDKLTMIGVDRSCGQLLDINIEVFGTDNLLRYVADRSPRLARLRLAQSSYRITDDGLIEAVSKLPLLTDIDLTFGLFTERAIRAIGSCCPLLKSFKFNSYPSREEEGEEALLLNIDAEAFAIAANMPGLSHLMLLGNTLSNVGLQAILDGCSHLVSLDLRCCFGVDLDGDLGKRCEQINEFRGPSDYIYRDPYGTEEDKRFKYGTNSKLGMFDYAMIVYRDRKERR